MVAETRLRLLGIPQLERDGAPVEGLRPKAMALLGYLATCRQPVARSYLAELFWPDKAASRGRANLSWFLNHLSSHLAGHLHTTRDTVFLTHSSTFWLDLAEFERLAAQDNGPTLEEAASLYRGPLLEGLTFDESPELESWVQVERGVWHENVLRVLEQAFYCYTEVRAWEAALRVAARLLAIEPWHEAMQRHEMRLLAQAGRRLTAIERFERFRHQLRAEQLEPEQETVALYESLLADHVGGELADGTGTTPLLNPYKGLHAFEESDNEHFFGRASMVARLVERLSARQGVPHFLAVVGPSGSGKTSVVQAGLLPALRGGALPGSEQWRIVSMHPGREPLAELEAALWRGAEDAPRDWYHTLEMDDGLLHAAERLLPANGSNGRGRRLLLVIDHFEELFTLTRDPEASDHFVTLLNRATNARDERLWVLVIVRADFFDRLLQLPALAPLLQNQAEFVVPLTQDELREAVARPAERAGLRLDAELLGTIVQEGVQRGTLPLIQYALTELVEQREGRTLTLAAYRASGGVMGALAQRSEAIYESLPEEQRTLAQQVFLRLITLGEGVEDTRRRVARRELESLSRDPELVQQVLEAFGRFRLLTFDWDATSGDPTVELAHEALLRRWPRLRSWLDESRARLRLHRQLHGAMTEWQSAGQESSFLARGAKLTQFEALLGNDALLLTTEEQGYLEASLTAREQQAQLEAEREARALEQALALARSEAARAETERRVGQRLRKLAVALVVALLFAVSGGLVARVQQRQAQVERAAAETSARLALARQLSAQAVQSMSGPVDLAVLLSLESLRLSDDTQDRTRLLTGLRLDPRLDGFLHQAPIPIFDLAFSERGQLLTSDEQGGVTLWDLSTRTQMAHFAQESEHPGGVALSRDGMRAATSHEATFTLWDMASQEAIKAFDMPESIAAMWFSEDGSRLITTSSDGTFIVWDTDDGQMLDRFIQEEGFRNLLALNHDGSRMVLGKSIDERPGAILWDVEARKPIGRSLVGHTAEIHRFSFSPDGSRLASASFDGTIRLWDAETGRSLGEPLRGHDGRVLFVDFSQDGATLVSAGTDRRVLLWDTATGQPLGPPLVGHNNWVRGAAFSTDGRFLATADVDGKIILWNLTARHLLQGHTDRVRNVAISPDGQTLVTTSFDKQLITWDGLTGEMRQAISTPHAAPILQSAYSPDGRTFATVDTEGVLILWDTDQWEPRFPPLQEHADVLLGLAFSPDSRLLATGDFSGMIVLWDTERGEKVGGPIKAHEGWAMSFAFSPDGSLLASGSTDGTIAFWEVATLKAYSEPILAHGNWVTKLLFTRDGARLLSASSDHTIRQWEVGTWQPIGEPMQGHDAQVWDLAFDSSDGQEVLVSLGGDGSVVWWDWHRAVPLAPPLLTGTETEVMALSPNGRYLYLATFDTTAQLWSVDGRRWEERACRLVNRNLSEEEWRMFLYDTPYVVTCGSPTLATHHPQEE